MQLYGGHCVNTILSIEWIKIDLQYTYKKPSNPIFTEKIQEVQKKNQSFIFNIFEKFNLFSLLVSP